MEAPLVFSCRDVLAASVDAIGGTELLFARVSEDGNLVQMQVSFSIPHPPEAGLMIGIMGVGQYAPSEAAAQESACFAALRSLQEQHDYIVLDYSMFRVWECKDRSNAFVDKLQNGRGTLANVLSQSVAAFRHIRSTFQFFGRKISNMRRNGGDGGTVLSASACASQLETIYEQAMQGHTARIEQFDEINDPGDLSALLIHAGFHVPDNQPDRVKLGGALEVILDTVSTHLGYLPPEFGMRTEDVRFKCYIRFVSAGAGRGRTFTGFGRVAYDPVTARHTALYNCLLAFSVNYSVVISDPNRDAYLFSKERVDEIGSDIVLLGDLGSAACSSVQETIRMLNGLIGGYSSVLSVHPVGQVLVQKLRALSSRFVQCLAAIGPLARPLNEEQ